MTTIESLYEYIDEESIDQSLICKICGKPFVEPIETPCQRVFCRRCMERSFNDDYVRCPACKELHFRAYITSCSDASIPEKLNKILVKCKLCNQNNIERGNIEDHINRICSKAIVTCPATEINCPWLGLREELHGHLTSPPNKSRSTSTNEENENLGLSCERYCVLEETHGGFLPFSNVNLQERNFQDQDLAVAVKALLLNKRCTYLDLFNKGISSRGASIIASVLYNDTLLETLGLRNNLICDSGVQHIAHALTTNYHLQRLDLNNNSITDTGARLLADMLKRNETLIKLTLSYNRISNEGMNALADVLINNNSTLQWLSLAGNIEINDSSSPSILNLIRYNRSLTTLNLESCNLSRWSKAQIHLYQLLYFNSRLELTL